MHRGKKPAVEYKLENPADALGVKVIKLVYELFTNAVHYQNYRLIKNSKRYDDDVTNELNKITKKSAVQMKDQTFNDKEFLSIIAFLKDFKVAWDA